MSNTEKKYPIPAAPEYDTEIRKLQNTDPANADEIFNPLIQKMIDNIHAVKLSDDEKAKKDLSNVLNSVFLEKVKAVGGNGSNLDADMVDGKHAADFAPAGFGLGTSCAVIPEGADLNDLPEPYKNASGFFTGGILQNKPLELAGWIYLIQSSGSPGFRLQIIFSVNGNELVMGNIFIRQCVNGVWKEWKKPDASTVGGKSAADLQNYNNLTNKPTIPTTLPANGGNADTVDGKHAADLQNYNNLTNKPTIPTTLPANGGNADTVDGKHAKDFKSADKNGNYFLSNFGDTGINLGDGDGATFEACNMDIQSHYGIGIRPVAPSTASVGRTVAINARNGDIKTKGQIYAATDKKVWHEGNDGSGSGLDADLLDGKQATDFIASDDGHKIGLSYEGNKGVKFRVDVTENVPVANAMNSDTVDGKHAADFAPSGFGLGTNCIVIPDGTDLNNLPAQYKHASGFFTGGTLLNKPKELAGWIYLFQMSGSASYKVQMVFNVNGTASLMGDIFIRHYTENVWTAWKKPDASTVGGKGVNVLYSNCSATAPTAYLGDNVQYQVY